MFDAAALNGSLSLRLDWSEGRVQQVDLNRPRASAHLSRLWVGRQPAEVAHLVPLVFSVCAQAQQLASVEALEAATDWPVDPQVNVWRRQAVRLEALRETLLMLQPFWQPTLPEQDLLPVLRACQRRLHLLQPFMVFQAVASPVPPGLPPELLDFQEHVWPQWQTITQSRSDQSPDLLLSPVACKPLQQQDLPQLLEQLRRGDATPTLGGQPRVTGPAAASQVTEVRLLLRARHERLLHQVTRLLDELTPFASGEAVSDSLPATRPHEGWSRVETARGWLIHRAVVQQGRVADYQLLAPTDWNLYARGLLYQQLLHLQIDQAELMPLAKDLLASSCPCVAFQVDVNYA